MGTIDVLSINDFIAGWLSGVCSVIVGHPMETIKVRQQTTPNFGPIQHSVKLFKHEGATGFFKGMSYPLWSAGILNSLFFGVYSNTLRMIEKSKGEEHHRTCCESTPVYKGWHRDCFYAGCIAGTLVTIVNTPIELVKTILQAHIDNIDKTHSRKSVRLTPTACIQNLFKYKGFKGCYHGGLILMIRDVPTYGLYGVCYEHILCKLRSRDHNNKFIRISQEGIAGGCSGVITWMVVLPVDVVKSRYMSDIDNMKNRKYTGLLDCVSKTYKQYGVKIFFNGFWVTTTRAFPVNLICFITYEQVLKFCKYVPIMMANSN